ncbi:hypothetical protein [Trinickia dinghuensis]|uniref:DUF1311 domain-containing protein n=1 Tax=Trinickia dinghuensis TaxID=2291023 RepID=A0A3D8K6C7_9BURK|nr:hypothetical protein [Trinickia dinghuensis]RDV00869.1 hypothetical protein DWV00_03810 [Trinickia dinghuensis]
MFDKRILAGFCTLALAIGSASAASAGGEQTYADILNGPATYVELAGANGAMSDAGCKRTDCLAIADLVHAFDILFRRDTPNTMTRTEPEDGNRIARANARFDQTVLVHRDRFSDYCAALTKLATHYSEYSLGFHTIEIATRLDAADQSVHCADSVMTAFPHSEESGEMIETARETCKNDHWGACREIRARR